MEILRESYFGKNKKNDCCLEHDILKWDHLIIIQKYMT